MTDLAIQTSAVAGAAAPAAKPAAADGFTDFLDTLVDIVNPLQHLPVVSTLYRSLTGDTINAQARMVGGALFGGPLGAAGALVNLIVEDATGHDIGDHALALLSGDGESSGDQLASLDGVVPAARRGEPVMVAYGDVNAMMPDAVAWNGKWQQPGAPATQQNRTEQRQAALEPSFPDDAGVASPATPVAPATHREASAATAPVKAIAQSAPPPSPPDPAAAAGAATPPDAPAWLATALAQAEQGRAATAAGREPALQATPEWISSAMSHALDKYQAMAVARSVQPAQSDSAAARDDD